MPKNADGSFREPDNDDRAGWAYEAVMVFAELTGLTLDGELREAVSDLLNDLGHLCDKHGLDFMDLVAGALAGWKGEVAFPSDGWDMPAVTVIVDGEQRSIEATHGWGRAKEVPNE